MCMNLDKIRACDIGTYRLRHRFILFLLFLWTFLFVKTVKAATLAEFMGDYDSQLLQWAAATALLGGMVRTILSLESDKRVITDVLKTAGWDAVKALISGMIAFFVIQALRSAGLAVPSEIRFTAVLAAGWSRIAALDWILGTGLDWLNARRVQLVSTPFPTTTTVTTTTTTVAPNSSVADGSDGSRVGFSPDQEIQNNEEVTDPNEAPVVIEDEPKEPPKVPETVTLGHPHPHLHPIAPSSVVSTPV